MEKTNNKTNETPIVIQMEQLKYTISKAIQDSKLPIFIVNPILKDFFQESNIMLQEYTKQELTKYQQANEESKMSLEENTVDDK